MRATRAPFRFRIKVSSRRFVRVSVSDTKENMWKAIEACQGTRHRHELACTVYFPGATDHGCVADLFFFWRGLRPGVIAHEAAHAAYNVLAVLKESIEPMVDDEMHAMWTEKIVERVWIRTQTAPL